MKKVLYLLILIFSFSELFADNWGYWNDNRSYIQIDFNGSKTFFYLYQGTHNSGLSAFNGANLGAFTSTTQTLEISAWDIKTWKTSGGDVTAAKLFYRIYKQGATPGSFIDGGGGWLENIDGSGNQKWGESELSDVNNIEIDISGLDPGATYYLAVFIRISGTGEPNGDKDDNNSGSYYIASFTTDSAFPVEFNMFSIKSDRNLVNLTWQTATEINNYGFEVERLDNLRGLNLYNDGNLEGFTPIGFVAGHGNSNSTKDYSFTDNTITSSGKYAYRLKQIDNDGSFSYSQVVETDVTVNLTYSLGQNYPNPFNPTTKISYSIPETGLVTLRVYNIIGETVAMLVNKVQEAGKYEVEFSGSSLSNGVYFYELKANGFTSVKKLMLLK